MANIGRVFLIHLKTHYNRGGGLILVVKHNVRTIDIIDIITEGLTKSRSLLRDKKFNTKTINYK